MARVKTVEKKAATRAAAPKKKGAPAAKKPAATKKAATKKPRAAEAPPKPRVFRFPFAKIYPLYVQKAERKGRTQAEVDTIIRWLTGYDDAQLRRVIAAGVDLETFFADARLNPKARLIEGVVCGVRVESIADPLMKKIRYLDKLIDELARGKKMASILRE